MFTPDFDVRLIRGRWSPGALSHYLADDSRNATVMDTAWMVILALGCLEHRLPMGGLSRDGRRCQLYLPLYFLRDSGQEEYERLRPMSYSKSHVILIAFAIDTPDSLDNVTVKVCYVPSCIAWPRI